MRHLIRSACSVVCTTYPVKDLNQICFSIESLDIVRQGTCSFGFPWIQ
jgi:hypothetical protein